MSGIDPIALLAHDLKSPLGLVKGAFTSLRRRCPESGTGIIEIGLKSVILVEQLVDEVVLLQSIGTAREARLRPLPPVTFHEVLLAAMLEAVGRLGWSAVGDFESGAGLAEIRRKLEALGVHLDVEEELLNRPLPKLPPGLVRVVMNLVGNAFRHGRPPIEIAARRADGSVEVAVTDAGPGLPEAALALLAGTPSDLAIERESLGLLGARWLVEGLRGTLEAGPGPAGRGTRIRVRIAEIATAPPSP
jgi:signal transduction histidine kinase